MAATLREKFVHGDVDREPDLLHHARSGSMRVETQNPIDRAAVATRPTEGGSEATASYSI